MFNLRPVFRIRKFNISLLRRTGCDQWYGLTKISWCTQGLTTICKVSTQKGMGNIRTKEIVWFPTRPKMFVSPVKRWSKYEGLNEKGDGRHNHFYSFYINDTNFRTDVTKKKGQQTY